MSVSRDMVRSWRNPRAVMLDLAAAGAREDRALAFLMGGCFLNFVASWPYAVRVEHFVGIDAQQQITGAMFLWFFVVPLFFYGLAGIIFAVRRAAGRAGTAYHTRLALFWALLATTPLSLFYGLLRGMNGDVTATQIIGGLWILAFIIMASVMMSSIKKE